MVKIMLKKVAYGYIAHQHMVKIKTSFQWVTTQNSPLYGVSSSAVQNAWHPVSILTATVQSPLSKTIERDGHSVEVEIYRAEESNRWILEVIDQDGNSTVWEDEFASDESALKEFESTLKKEGINALIGTPVENG